MFFVFSLYDLIQSFKFGFYSLDRNNLFHEKINFLIKKKFTLVINTNINCNQMQLQN